MTVVGSLLRFLFFLIEAKAPFFPALVGRRKQEQGKKRKNVFPLRSDFFYSKEILSAVAKSSAVGRRCPPSWKILWGEHAFISRRLFFFLLHISAVTFLFVTAAIINLMACNGLFFVCTYNVLVYVSIWGVGWGG